MTKPRALIAGNWKMNGLSRDARALTDSILRGSATVSGPELLICPPATLIAVLAPVLSGSSVALGGQDCHSEESGAHTGDVAAKMLADLGCRYVIVGHSERRTDHGETNAVVQAKAQAARRAGLTPIVCVGETWTEREAGKTADVVTRQVKESVPAGATPDTLVVAYEPVWAIGSGRTPTIEQVAEVHALIRRDVGAGVRLLYGGSVKPSNASELMAVANVDGALVGGASLKAEDFLAIAAAVR